MIRTFAALAVYCYSYCCKKKQNKKTKFRLPYRKNDMNCECVILSYSSNNHPLHVFLTCATVLLNNL